MFREVLTHFQTNRKYIVFNCSALFALVYVREKPTNICRPNELVFHQLSMLCSEHTLNEMLHNHCLGTHVQFSKTVLIISVNEIYCPYAVGTVKLQEVIFKNLCGRGVIDTLQHKKLLNK